MKQLLLIGLLLFATFAYAGEDPAIAAREAAAALASGDYPAAEASAERAVRMKPTFAEAWVGLGLAQARQNKIEQAESSFEQALSLHRTRYEKEEGNGHELLQQVYVLSLLHRDREALELLHLGKTKFPEYVGFKIPEAQIAAFREILTEED